MDNVTREASRKYLGQSVLLFLFSAAYLYPFVRVLWRVGDEGSIVYGAQRVSEGSLPYRDFFEVMGPATFYWLGLFFNIFGIHFSVARSLLLLTGGMTVLLLYWMTQRLYRGPVDLCPAIFILVMSIPVWPASNHHWDSNLFALLAIASFFLWQDTRWIGFLLVSGVAAGLTSCFMPQKGLFLVLALLIAELADGFSKGKSISAMLARCLLLLISYGSVGMLVLVYFYWASGLPDLLYATLIWPLSNYQGVNVVPYGHGLFEFLWPSWRSVLEAFLPILLGESLAIVFLIPFLFILALPVLVAVLATLVGLRRQTRRSIFNARTLPYWTVSVALWLSEIHRLDTKHLIYGSPMLVVILLFLWTTYCQSRKFLKMSGIVFIMIPLGLFGAFNVFVAVNAAEQQLTRRGSIRVFAEDTALKFLHEEVKEGDSIFVYPYYPMYYFLANVRNPTRHSILMYHINTETQFSEVISDLERKKVNYVLWDTVVEGARLSIWFPEYRHPAREKLRLEHYLETHYQVIDVKSGFKILRRITG